MKSFRIITLTLIILSIIFTSQFSVAAKEAYNGYTYNISGESVASQVGYSQKSIVNIKSVLSNVDGLSTASLESPTDMFVDSRGYVYLLDSGNSRVIVLDNEFHFYKAIEKFTLSDGVTTEFSNANGLYVNSSGIVFVADTDNGRVLSFDENGKVVCVYKYDNSAIANKNMDFRPIKVVVNDRTNFVYVLSEGFYEGALVFKNDGQFSGFFGSNSVEVTAELMADKLWKKIFSNEMASFLSRYVPDEFSNLDIDKEGFIYTCSYSRSTVTDAVKKLNASGTNVLRGDEKYGERENAYVDGVLVSSQFSDIYMSENFLHILDSNSGKIFQYDKTGNFVFAFGGLGQQEGTFRTPVAVDGFGDLVYVLDSVSGNITVFEPTHFGKTVHSALLAFLDGKYDESINEWYEVLKIDNHFPLAFLGITKYLIANEQYEDALFYAKKANSKADYSYAFEQVRFQKLEKAFVYIAVAVVLFVLALLIAPRFIKKKENKKTRVFGTAALINPLVVFDEAKRKKQYKWILPIIVVFIWFVAEVFRMQYTGFLFASGNGKSLLFKFMGTFILFASFVIINWLISLSNEGKGHLVEIATVTAYSLMPFIAATIINTILSHVLITNEWAIAIVIYGIAVLWGVYIIFAGMMAIHEYTFSKMIVSLMLTLVGICIEIFLALLAFALLQQTYSFFKSIIMEMIPRIV